MDKNELSRRALLKFGATGMLVGAAAATPRLGSTADGCGAFPRERFDQYITLFNNNDPRFTEFYHDDVVLELGATQIRGPQGIGDFYKNVKTYIKESLEVTQYVADASGIAVELPSQFGCFKDWPDSFWGRPIKKGEVLRIVSFVLYRIEDGKFKHIKSARYKQVNDWQQEGFTA